MINNPAVSGTDCVGKFLAKMFALIIPLCVNLPLVPDFNTTFLEPAYVIALRLVEPKHFENGRLKGDKFSGKDGKFFR